MKQIIVCPGESLQALHAPQNPSSSQCHWQRKDRWSSGWTTIPGSSIPHSDLIDGIYRYLTKVVCGRKYYSPWLCVTVGSLPKITQFIAVDPCDGPLVVRYTGSPCPLSRSNMAKKITSGQPMAPCTTSYPGVLL